MRKGGRQERRELQLASGEILYGSSMPVSSPTNESDQEIPLYDGLQPVWGTANRPPAAVREKAAAMGKTKERRQARWPYALLLVFCLLGLLANAYILAPQLLGIRFRYLPNYAFTSLGMIRLDEDVLREYRATMQTVYQDTFYPGVSIDGVDLSGLSVDEGRARIMAVPAENGQDFSVTVDVQGQTWTIDSKQVPMTRDLEDQLRIAYALGRTQTEGPGSTPAQRRYEAIRNLESGVRLATSLSYDTANIRVLTDQIAASVYKAPENAYVAAFDVTTRSFVFGSDVSGWKLDADALFRSVMQKLEKGDNYGTVKVKPRELIADYTKGELINSFHRISSYSTKTTDNKNRNTNIQLSCQAINGVMVGPGETFSFNSATGERTAAKGYKPATAISGGQNIEEVGGGVCQTSSTLFNAAARANLEIVTRSPHAWPSSYVEKGMDATVNWPGLDFRFRNNTDWPIYIIAEYANRKVTVELYGMSLGDGVTIDLESQVVRTMEAPSGIQEVRNESLKPGTRKTTVKARKGYVVDTYQVWYQNGKEIQRKKLCTSTYKAYQETVEYN